MATGIPPSLETAGDIDGARLRLTLAWHHDRHCPAVEIVSADSSRHLAVAARESTSLESWPASPPIQQLMSHVTPSGVHALLGVGMAGTNHWSISVEASSCGDVPTLVWDVACRLPWPAGADWPGNLKETFGPRSEFRVHLPASPEPGRWELGAIAPATNLVARPLDTPLGPTRMLCDNPGVVVFAPPAPPELGSAASKQSPAARHPGSANTAPERASDAGVLTVRWRFAWQLAPQGDPSP